MKAMTPDCLQRCHCLPAKKSRGIGSVVELETRLGLPETTIWVAVKALNIRLSPCGLVLADPMTGLYFENWPRRVARAWLAGSSNSPYDRNMSWSESL